jgi:hypothetical protein
MIRRSFVLGTAGLVLLPTRGFAADTVSGRFVGNGKEAKLAFASAWVGDPFSGKETVVIVLSEKDQSASKKPSFDASFGKLGAALVMTLTRPDGRLIGTQVAHGALKRSGMSVSGSEIKGEGVTITDKRVEGRFFMEKPSKFFDDTYEFDVKVATDIRPRPA